MAWLSVAVQATPGDLDLTFGSGGKVISPFTEYSDQISSIQVRPDGKIIVSGYSYGYDGFCPCEYEAMGFLARYNSSGTLDASFGTVGIVYPVDRVTNSFYSILGFKTVLQPDGKIVVIGQKIIYTAPNQVQIDFAVWRYNSEGTLDTSFGTGGKVSTPVGTLHDFARDVVLQPDGKIVVTGLIAENGSAKFATVRYNSDGSLDNNFGTGGKVITAIDGPNEYSQPHSLLLQSDGKIVVVGNRRNYLGTSSAVLIRYNANGSLDPAFGTNGIVIYLQIGYNDGPLDSLLQPDGQIVTGGGSQIVRFKASGSVDTSFAAPHSVGKGIALQPDGKIVAFGTGSIPLGVGFAAERFNPDGSLDTSFGSNGRVLTPVGTNGQSHGLAVALQPDGKILGGGVTNVGEGVGDAAIVRYMVSTGNPTPTPTATPAATPTNTPTATPTATPAPGACTFSNGGLNPQATSKSGVAAPAGFFWSEVQNPAGNTAESNRRAGFAAIQDSNRLADNFTITQTCTIQTISFYAYQTNGPATTPFTATSVQIWNGRPGDVGATVVFGDPTTDRLASSIDTTFFRIFNTVAPPPGTAPGTTRKIWRNTVTVNTVLAPGTYWVDWASTAAGEDPDPHFYPSKTIEGVRGAAGDNARQETVFKGAWADVIDTGAPKEAPDFPQDFPFDVVGAGAATPTPTATPTNTPTVTPTPTPTGTPTASPTPAGFESDVAPRQGGDGSVLSTDIIQVRRFATGLDAPDPASNEFQRADSSPRGTFGDGTINAGDVVQARRYGSGLDPLTNAGGPTMAADVAVRAVIGGSVFREKVGEDGLLRLVSWKDGAVSVELESIREVAAVSFGLRYDPALGRPMVSAGELPEGSVLTVNDTVEGELTILIDSSGPLGGVSKAFRLIEIVFASAAANGLVVFDGEASLADGFGNDLGVLFKAQKQARY